MRQRGKRGQPGDVEGPGSTGHLTSHPPVLLQLPGGYKHSDLSVSSIPEILHCHGNASAREEVLEAMSVGYESEGLLPEGLALPRSPCPEAQAGTEDASNPLSLPTPPLPPPLRKGLSMKS